MTVTRTADDLPRYHGKMTIIDDELFVLGFNFTRQDIERSRSFGLITRDKKLVKEAAALFEADATRQPYTPRHDRFVVSPDTSRERLGGADRQRPQAAADLRRRDLRQADAAAAPRAGRGGRRDPGDRQARQADPGVADPEAVGHAAARAGHRSATAPRRVHRQPEPAQAGARRSAARSASSSRTRGSPARCRRCSKPTGSSARPPKDPTPRRSTPTTAPATAEPLVDAGIRVITPESTIRPVRDIALNVSSFLEDLGGQKRQVRVEALASQAGAAIDVAAAQLAARSHDEVGDALLQA